MRATCQAKSAPYNILSWIMAKVVRKVGKVAPERARLSKCLYANEEMREMFLRVNTQWSGQSEKYKVGV